MKRINKELLGDYRVLKQCLGDSKESYPTKEKLKVLGLSFKRFTHMETIEERKEPVLALYDICFYRYNEKHFKLIKI
ncbi:hypothetical protein [Winogradskyella forsetii]|uniref:hypothetical protein n=1 Tax=Winogradskyella forsetii TaxID=2686077 RepID=UPI0015BF5E3A|nr:hypothetical protein [Winogradskyella forsetii]